MSELIRNLKEQSVTIERQFEQLEHNLQSLDNNRSTEKLPSVEYLISVRGELEAFHKQFMELLESVRRDMEKEKHLRDEIRATIDEVYQTVDGGLHLEEVNSNPPKESNRNSSLEDSMNKVEVNGSSEIDIAYLLNKSFPKLQPL